MSSVQGMMSDGVQVILWELLTGQRPWAGLLQMQVRCSTTDATTSVSGCARALSSVPHTLGWSSGTLYSGSAAATTSAASSLCVKCSWSVRGLHACCTDMPSAATDRQLALLANWARQGCKHGQIGPYADAQVIFHVTIHRKRLELPDTCEPGFKSLCEACMSTESSERPRFTDVLARLDAL